MNASYKRLDRIKCETMQESFSILDFYSRQESHSYRPEPKFRATDAPGDTRPPRGFVPMAV
jgi:hypothetical protein